VLNVKWIVHKFGGASVANAGGYRTAARILAAQHRTGEHAAVVVSAGPEVTAAGEFSDLLRLTSFLRAPL
jgi:aspartokinase